MLTTLVHRCLNSANTENICRYPSPIMCAAHLFVGIGDVLRIRWWLMALCLSIQCSSMVVQTAFAGFLVKCHNAVSVTAISALSVTPAPWYQCSVKNSKRTGKWVREWVEALLGQQSTVCTNSHLFFSFSFLLQLRSEVFVLANPVWHHFICIPQFFCMFLAFGVACLSFHEATGAQFFTLTSVATVLALPTFKSSYYFFPHTRWCSWFWFWVLDPVAFLAFSFFLILDDGVRHFFFCVNGCSNGSVGHSRDSPGRSLGPVGQLVVQLE